VASVLRDHQPPTLVVWGKFDPSFDVAEAEAYRRDLPNAETMCSRRGIFRWTNSLGRLPG
jgi:pimeloyl-ACP methyl ester carboxylesterase